MRRSHIISALLVILLLGFLARLAAARWNWFMHSDVAADAGTTASVRRDGQFLDFPSKRTLDPAQYVLPPASEGTPIVLHGPFVPLVGAGLVAVARGAPTFAHAYLALRILSLTMGTLIILLTFLITARLVGSEAGLAAGAWTAVSFVLIDYAGNGAIYTTQGALYLLWLLAALSKPSRRSAIAMAVCAGLAYLVSFQAVILGPVSLLVIAARTRPWKAAVQHAILFGAVALLIAAPWLVRNAVVFGDPLYSHNYNLQYMYGKAGLAEKLPNVSFMDKLGMLHAVITLWTPNNLYYAARKLFVITPVAFLFFSYGLIDVTFSPKRFKRALPVLLLLAFQMLLYAAWPVWKFRFFVPLLPCVFILAAEELWHLPIGSRIRNAAAGATLCAVIAISVLTYYALPTHTTYFDGALTQDPFHGNEELHYLRQHDILPPADAP